MDSQILQKPSSKKSNQLQYLLMGLGAGLGVICIIGIIVLSLFPDISPFNSNPNAPANKQTQAVVTPPSNNVLAKVGNEFIYKDDLALEMQYAPGNDPNKEEVLRKKLVQDSIILQGAAADKLIELNGTVFNAPSKDYLKRIELVRTAEEQIKNTTNKISGTVITIWFFNNDTYGELGPEKSKELALKKITEYYQLVLKKQITIDQALERIKTDSSLDPLGEHKNNAGYIFDIAANQEPSYDENFNKSIRQTKPGQLTPVTLLLDKNVPGKPKEALYAFALIKNKTNTSKFSSYEEWLTAKTKEYAVITY